MKFKKSIVIFTLILSILFTLSCVGASDVNDTYVANVDDDVIGQTNDTPLAADGDGTFFELQKQISSAPAGATITLDKNYVYDGGFDKFGILIDKDLTINGNGHTLDGLSKSRILVVNYGSPLKHNKVVLNNISFKNGNSIDYGGAILNFGDLTVDHCVFKNNYAGVTAGAINSIGVLNCKNSVFKQNSAKGDAGAIFSLNFEFSFKYYADYFKNHKIEDIGGIFTELSLGNTLNFQTDSISDCYFKNNVAKGRGGGAIYGFSHLNIVSSTFTSNKANEKGGAVFGCKDLFIKNSKFTNNQVPMYGGAVYFKGHEQSGSYVNGTWVPSLKFYSNLIQNSVFTHNIAKERGGAIYGFKFAGAPDVPCAQAVKCTFSDNKSPHGKNIYGGTLKNCIFKNTKITLKTVKVKKSLKKLVLSATVKKGSSAVKNKLVTFKFNGNALKGKTNSKGIAKVVVKSSILKKLKVGKTVKYSASYSGVSVKKTAKVYN